MRYKNEVVGNDEEEWSCIDEKVEGTATAVWEKDEKEKEDLEEASERSWREHWQKSGAKS
jgi:hypothetical protein